MKQTLLKISLWIKRYDQNSEQMLFFNIVFKAIWALLSYDYFQIIVNSLISLGWHILSSSLGPMTKIYKRVQNEVSTHMLKFLPSFNTTYDNCFLIFNKIERAVAFILCWFLLSICNFKKKKIIVH